MTMYYTDFLCRYSICVHMTIYCIYLILHVIQFYLQICTYMALKLGPMA